MLREAERWNCEGERRTCIGQNSEHARVGSTSSGERAYEACGTEDALVHICISDALYTLAIVEAEDWVGRILAGMPFVELRDCHLTRFNDCPRRYEGIKFESHVGSCWPMHSERITLYIASYSP